MAWFHDHGRRALEIANQCLGIGGSDVARGDRRGHVADPCVTLALTDCEAEVPHAKARMTAAFAVVRRTAPVLGEERGQVSVPTPPALRCPSGYAAGGERKSRS